MQGKLTLEYRQVSSSLYAVALNASPPRQVGIRGQTHETKYNEGNAAKQNSSMEMKTTN